jgi:hypothetical protein
MIGLEKYLNDTKLIHNNKGYSDFKEYVEHRVPLTVVGRLFHVGRPTAVKWHDIYKKEQE